MVGVPEVRRTPLQASAMHREADENYRGACPVGTQLWARLALSVPTVFLRPTMVPGSLHCF